MSVMEPRDPLKPLGNIKPLVALLQLGSIGLLAIRFNALGPKCLKGPHGSKSRPGHRHISTRSDGMHCNWTIVRNGANMLSPVVP